MRMIHRLMIVAGATAILTGSGTGAADAAGTGSHGGHGTGVTVTGDAHRSAPDALLLQLGPARNLTRS